MEEAISRAKIRHCPKCKKAFLKESGCNKMTCGCGAKSCEWRTKHSANIFDDFLLTCVSFLCLKGYICRVSINDYSHFCQKVRTLSIWRATVCSIVISYPVIELASLPAPEMQEVSFVDKRGRGKCLDDSAVDLLSSFLVSKSRDRTTNVLCVKQE